ncbi:hypothetical protein [Flavobacterium sp. KACC 22761]|uniref:hypothetical protein n=1 Tax=Flavobacterium sp. KACC 22761 TaxID=3092665 RepID=UPI002A75AFC5|nr:hypothetical protein [Flavobacterium sp. KACC 22761]WPO80783.1 hypothetical protein SCB73_10400 [Flavobacterium sp. KACC 22761]
MSQKIKKIVVLSIVLMISVVFSRCQNDDDNVSNPEISNVSLAKKWFKEYESSSENYALFENLDYEWNQAEIKKSKDGMEVIVVPVYKANKHADEIWEQKLYLYKLGIDEYQALLFEIYPDKSNEIENVSLIDDEDFNGHIVAWDLKTGFVKAANFKNNKLVANGTVKEFSGKKAISQKMAPIAPDDDDIYSDRGLWQYPTTVGGGSPTPLRDVVVNNNYRNDNYHLIFVGNGSSLNTGGSSNDYTSGNAGGGGAGGGNNNSTTVETPPSCRAFEYSNVTSNWQTAATKNIVALIGYYDVATGEYNVASVLYPQQFILRCQLIQHLMEVIYLQEELLN